ncbi:unnamed protein product [Tenebrio molitor]|nr:unnamed protein product [Tenebrio molitor]
MQNRWESSNERDKTTRKKLGPEEFPPMGPVRPSNKHPSSLQTIPHNSRSADIKGGGRKLLIASRVGRTTGPETVKNASQRTLYQLVSTHLSSSAGNE